MSASVKILSQALCLLLLVSLASCITLDYSPRLTMTTQYGRGGVCTDAELSYISGLVLSKVNSERRNSGQSALKWDSRL
ncbi:MAG: hypothetical protein LLF86_05265, partial [Nitrospiraceae bacterium]|nr:hypothetical protein [Nitrospiraceae bacterium]